MLRAMTGIVLILISVSVSAQEDAALVDAAYNYLATNGDSSRPALRLFLADLNTDGRMDGIVLLTGSHWCGSGGCNMLIFKGVEGGYALLSKSSVVQEPVALLAETVQGWHTLVITSGGTGQVLMRFNANAYPSNPSLQPKASEANIAQAQILTKVLHQ